MTKRTTEAEALLSHQAIINGAVESYFKNLDEAAQVKAASSKIIDAEKAKVAMVADNSLAVLDKGLEDYHEPITEDAWNAYFRAEVRQQVLKATNPSGYPRYTNDNSRDQAVHMFKVTSIGLTHARTDKRFIPSEEARKNLKKYMDQVKPKLQEAGLLSSQDGVLPEKPLPGKKQYWLLGSKTQYGVPNTLLAASQLMSELQKEKLKFPEMKKFTFIVGEAEPLPEPKEEPPRVLFSNATATANTVSSNKV